MDGNNIVLDGRLNSNCLKWLIIINSVVLVWIVECAGKKKVVWHECRIHFKGLGELWGGC